MKVGTAFFAYVLAWIKRQIELEHY